MTWAQIGPHRRMGFAIGLISAAVIGQLPMHAQVNQEQIAGAMSAANEASQPLSADLMTFRNKRSEILSLISTYGCKNRDPLHDVRLTPSALQVTGLVGYSIRDYRSGRYLILFDDVKAVEARVMTNAAQCWEWSDSVRIHLKSGRPDKYLWILLTSPDAALQFTDDLNWIVSHSAEIATGAAIKGTQFKERASAWRAAAVKPAMPEEAREHQVLAENAYREKDLRKTIEEYEAGLEIFPTWPEGQFNVALICGETGNYDCAVEHMQDYLELVPTAPDAQAAADKLIVWKDKLGSNGSGPVPSSPQADSSNRR